GVVHRDIKPENVLLDQDGNVHIADFGLAKVLGADGDTLTLTRTRQGLGTPHYMAPEQVESAGEVDHRADIYSLGVMFYELLTGKLPIGRFEPPSHEAKAAKAFDDVVMGTLESDPARRIQSAREVKARIEGAPMSTTAPGAIGRYRRDLTVNRKSLAADAGRALPPIPWYDLTLFVVVVFGLFMPWADQRIMPDGLKRFDAWNISVASIPAWLVAVAALVVVVIRCLRFAGYAVDRMLAIWVLVPAVCYTGWLAITAQVSDIAEVRAGLGVTFGALLCWLFAEVQHRFGASRQVPLAERRRRRRVARARR
ncbi:MAG: serine/threonine protein kinase, partial [Planctomycetes bacterium]|nr:serine/threonine protein kinase [Planctomycetota bacterium]